MKLSLFQLLILAVVQGITEFLPISSDGHLAVLSQLMAPGQDLGGFVELNIVLHLGTLGSILVFYWREILKLLGEDRRLIPLLMVATVPSVLVGLPLRELGEAYLGDALLAGCMLPITGALLLVAKHFQRPQLDYQQISFRQALAIGLAQPFALLPGISRSGTTITAGLISGLTPKAATTFSFLMAIPAIAGAGAYELFKISRSTEERQFPLSWLLLGAVLSFVVGLVAIRLLVGMVQRNRLHWFAWWCIPLGVIVVAWQLYARAPAQTVKDRAAAVISFPNETAPDYNRSRMG
jgi:undecaprenyl-diphosphatase